MTLYENAFLWRIQDDNNCTLTGEPCRTPNKNCGCWLEMEAYADLMLKMKQALARDAMRKG